MLTWNADKYLETESHFAGRNVKWYTLIISQSFKSKPKISVTPNNVSQDQLCELSMLGEAETKPWWVTEAAFFFQPNP